MKHLMGRTRKIIHLLWGDWLILCANPSMQIGQFFVRGMHQWIPAAAMSLQPTVCLLVVVRMASSQPREGLLFFFPIFCFLSPSL